MALFQLFLYNHVGQNGIGTSIGKELFGTSHKGMGDAVESPAFVSLLDLGSWSGIWGGWCWVGTQRYAGWMHGALCPAAPCTDRSDLLLFLAVMLIVCGALVNGPYALITTAVSADLVRGTSQTPRSCSLFPGGMFAGISAFQLCFAKLGAMEEGRAVTPRTLVPTFSETQLFSYAVSLWLCDSALAPLHLPLHFLLSVGKRTVKPPGIAACCWESRFCQGLAAAASEFDLPSVAGSDTWRSLPGV